jgi:hypothetical protein
MIDGINAIPNRRVKIPSGTSIDLTHGMRDLYHRQNRLTYSIKRVVGRRFEESNPCTQWYHL